MSLDAYQRALARMVSDPAYRRRVTAEADAILVPLGLDARERKRLLGFANDPGMRVNTALYRANRLAPIYAAMRRTCAELGWHLGDVLRRFWGSNELVDLQFPSEAARFYTYLVREEQTTLSRVTGLEGLAAIELALFELLVGPRRRLTGRVAPRSSRDAYVHPLIRVIPVAVEPHAMISVFEHEQPLNRCPPGAGGILVDYRRDQPALEPLAELETSRLLPVRAGRRVTGSARSWLSERELLVAKA